MSGGICHLCFEGSVNMADNFQEKLQTTEIQEFVEVFCQFMFDVSAFRSIKSIKIRFEFKLNLFTGQCKYVGRNLYEMLASIEKFWPIL